MVSYRVSLVALVLGLAACNNPLASREQSQKDESKSSASRKDGKAAKAKRGSDDGMRGAPSDDDATSDDDAPGDDDAPSAANEQGDGNDASKNDDAAVPAGATKGSGASAMSNHQIQELEASIRELEATAATAGPGMRPILDQQIANLKSTRDLLKKAQPAMEANKQHRPALTPEVSAAFQPQPAANVPAWIPDNAKKSEITPDMMRCPGGAKVYDVGNAISCSIPGEAGASLSTPHGLTLRFRSDGRLASQDFYEQGLSRWAIGYHSNGQRESVGFYVSTEPKTYVEQGLHTRYAANGVVIAQTEWSKGKKQGWHKLWEDDGYPISAKRYDNGSEVESVNPLATRD